MKLTHWFLAALAPLAVAGWSGAFLGHFAVLAVTVGIFVGTLSLGRQRLSHEVEGSRTVVVEQVEKV
jgi:hypothetical protein